MEFTSSDLDKKLKQYQSEASFLRDVMISNFSQIFSHVQSGKGLVIYSDIFRSPDVLAGFPDLQQAAAIVVGAGPSLDDDMEAIFNAMDTHVIIAADAALPALNAHGCLPHLVVICDHSDRQVKNFHSIDLTNRIVFAATCIHPDSLKAIQKTGAKIVWYNIHGDDAVSQSIVRIGGRKGAIIPAVLTTGMAFQIAIWLGIYRIAFVGNDLYYPDYQSGYASKISQEKKQFQIDTKYKRNLCFFPNKNGDPVITSDTFVAFYTWMNVDNASWIWHGVNVYDCCPSGLLYGERIKPICLPDYVESYGISDLSRKALSILNQRYDKEDEICDFLIGSVDAG